MRHQAVVDGESALAHLGRHRARLVQIAHREVEALLLRPVPELGVIETLAMPARQVPHAAVLDRRVVEREPHADGAVLCDIEVVVVLMPADLAAGVRRLVEPLVVDQPKVRPEQAFNHVEEPRVVDEHAKDRMAQMRGPDLVHLELVVRVFAGLHVLQRVLPRQALDGLHVARTDVVDLAVVEIAVDDETSVAMERLDLCGRQFHGRWSLRQAGASSCGACGRARMQRYPDGTSDRPNRRRAGATRGPGRRRQDACSHCTRSTPGLPAPLPGYGPGIAPAEINRGAPAGA